MKKLLFILFILATFTTTSWARPDHDQNIKIATARKAAENWINLIIQKKGVWGDADSAYVENIQPLQYQGKPVGYFCKVLPKGYIILTLRKEFSPVKAYSSISDLDPKADTGMADMIKEKMAKKIRHIEKRLGVLNKIPARALENMLGKSHHPLWDKLVQEEMDAGGDVSTDLVPMDYQQGYFLLTSKWEQTWPYNKFTPLGTDFYPYIYPCLEPANKEHTLVGCVAVAGSQIMRYWNWPPYGEVLSGVSRDPYDWPNMLDKLTYSDDPEAPPVTDESKDAVAELCSEVGIHVDMDYGCSGSGADSSDMVYVFDEPFRYSGYVDEMHYTNLMFPDIWFEAMKVQLNQNRPVYYTVPGDPGHAVVLDGWQELPFTPPVRQFHLNWGQMHDSHTTWYTLDEYGFEHMGDGMIINIFPAQALLGTVSGPYIRNPAFPYFYLDRETQGEDAVFESGINLQFLKGVKLTNTSTSNGIIRIEGLGSFSETNTRLFTLSDSVVSNGIQIYNGIIELYGNGSIKMY